MTEPAPDRRVHPALPLIVGLLLGGTAGFVVAKQLTPAPKAGAVSTVYITSTVTAAGPTAAPVPTATGPRVLALGTTATVTGAKVTAYAYRSPVATGMPAPAEAGHVWGAIDVKVCVTELSTLSRDPWTIVYADAGQISASNIEYGGFPTPDYPAEKTIPAGRCVRGWITCAVPKGKKPTMIDYALASGETVDWRI